MLILYIHKKKRLSKERMNLGACPMVLPCYCYLCAIGLYVFVLPFSCLQVIGFPEVLVIKLYNKCGCLVTCLEDGSASKCLPIAAAAVLAIDATLYKYTSDKFLL